MPGSILSLIANSAVPDEMPGNAAFHLGLHCLPKLQYTKVSRESLVSQVCKHYAYTILEEDTTFHKKHIILQAICLVGYTQVCAFVEY